MEIELRQKRNQLGFHFATPSDEAAVTMNDPKATTSEAAAAAAARSVEAAAEEEIAWRCKTREAFEFAAK